MVKHSAFIRQALRDAPGRAVRRTLAAWLDCEFQAVGSLSRARRLRALCPVPGARVADYAPRLLTLGDGARALVHVRFKGGDPSWPFVQWVACDEPFDQPGALFRRSREAREAFAALTPRATRIWIPSGAPWEPGDGRGLRWLAESLDAIRCRPPLDLPPGFSLEPFATADIHGRYVREYRAFLRANPKAASWIHVEGLPSLRVCERQGALFALKSGRGLCGLVALRREATPWFDGWCVVESHLFNGFRGRGLAAPMHRAAYERLRSRRGDCVWGTIDPANRQSLATAKRVGRVEIGGEWWIPASV